MTSLHALFRGQWKSTDARLLIVLVKHSKYIFCLHNWSLLPTFTATRPCRVWYVNTCSIILQWNIPLNIVEGSGLEPPAHLRFSAGLHLYSDFPSQIRAELHSPAPCLLIDKMRCPDRYQEPEKKPLRNSIMKTQTIKKYIIEKIILSQSPSALSIPMPTPSHHSPTLPIASLFFRHASGVGNHVCSYMSYTSSSDAAHPCMCMPWT